MTRTKNFALGETYDGILSDLVNNGQFETETDAVKAGIRLLADHEMRVQSLRQAIDAADQEIAAGRGQEYNSAADLLADVMTDDDR